MHKEVLACDVDGVLFPLLSHFLEDYNNSHGTNLTPADFKTYDFDGPLGLSVPETVDKIYAFLRADHSHIEPLEEAEYALERLETRFTPEIVTARHSDFETSTWQWLQEKLPNRFTAIKSVGYAPIMERPVTKVEICKQIGAVALIDDSLGHVRLCPPEGIDGVLFGDYSWNQSDELPRGVTRCEDWPKVVEHFNV